jgi:hypothetical protein
VTPAGARGRRGQLALDVEEGSARNMPVEIELPTALGLAELPAAVDELVPQRTNL